MIHSVVVRLSLLYLAIVMTICVGFSMLLYRTASIELERELRRPLANNAATMLLGADFERLRSARLQESHAHLRGNLFLVNLLTLVGAGAISYYAARRTILPIQTALDAQARFAGDASHELRTPLAAMQTEIEVALRDQSLKKQDMRELLDSNLEEIAKLQVLSENLLKLARQSEQRLELAPITVPESVHKAWQRLEKTAGQNHISLITDSKRDKVLANPTGLEELLYILLDNAVKYSPAGKAVTVRTIVHAKSVIIEVADQGPGIAPDKLQHIFERFYRADSSRTKSAAGGFGLGLAIAANIARMHKTDIKVKSKLGAGASFSIQLKKAS